MWASAVLGSPGSATELSSPKISLNDKICFTFWLDMTVWSNRLSSSYNDTLHQEATGIDELVIYLESEVWEEGLPSYQRRKIWEFHEVLCFPTIYIIYIIDILDILSNICIYIYHIILYIINSIYSIYLIYKYL